MISRLMLCSLVLLFCLFLAGWQATAEEFEALHCFGGMAKAFHESEGLAPLSSFVHNGIVTSKNQRLDKLATHCEGVQRGVGATRFGYFLCKLVDRDGDAIVVGDQYAGTKYPVRFAEGTGKWKGIKGQFESEVTAAASKPAIAGAYHTCTTWKGAFEVAP